MKKLIVLVLAIVFLSGICYAQDLNLTFKQGALYSWKDSRTTNLTTVEIARTKVVDSWGKFNILWDGWSLDAGFNYDADVFNVGALLLGREFGTIGKYLPIDFPLKDKISITLYPIGLLADDLFNQPKFRGCSGAAILKIAVSI